MNVHCHRSILLAILAAAAVAAVSGCSHVSPAVGKTEGTDPHLLQSDQLQQIDHLTHALLALDPAVSEIEAASMARSAVTHTATLGQRYQVVRPPELHNLLVKIGLKKRGLCYHWTEDLMMHLNELLPHRLQLQRVVANQGSLLHEHHSVVVTSREKPLAEGIILDGWRGSGRLVWKTVGEDRFTWVLFGGQRRIETAADAH